MLHKEEPFPLRLRRKIDFRKFKEVVCRATLSWGVRVEAFRDGMFAFGLSKRLSGQRPQDETPIEALIRTTAAKMPLLNARLACLYTASGRLQALAPPKMIISPEAVIAMESFEEDDGTTMDERFGAMMLGRRHGAYPNFAYPKDMPTNLDWRLSRGITFEVDTVAESFRLFHEILLHPAPDTLVLVDLYARSCKV